MLAAVVLALVGLAGIAVELYAWWTVAHSAGHPPAWALWLLLLVHR